jgi:hypothetical protein
MTDLNTPLLADLVKISFSSDGRVAVFEAEGIGLSLRQKVLGCRVVVFEAEGIGFDPILGQCSSFQTPIFYFINYISYVSHPYIFDITET